MIMEIIPYSRLIVFALVLLVLIVINVWILCLVEGLELFMFALGFLVRLSQCGDMIPYDWIICALIDKCI
jgi:hypothetical protein